MAQRLLEKWCLAEDLDLARLPRFNFFELAGQTPVVLQEGVIFYLVDDPTVKEPCFVFENIRFGLVPSQSLLDMESQYFDIFSGDIEQYKTRYLNEVVDRRIQTIRDLQRKLAQNRVLAFLVTDLIPKFMELNLGQEHLAQQQKKKREQIGQGLLELKAEPEALTSSILEQVIGSRALILDEKVYPLAPITPQAGRDLILQLNSACFGLTRPCRFLSEVEAAVMRRLRQLLHEQALSEAPERRRILQEIETEEREMTGYLYSHLTATDDEEYLYQDKERGIFRRNRVWYVYLEVPPYVVEDADGTLYNFDATRVGVAVQSCNPEVLLTPSRAQVLTPYEHMFVSSKTAGGSICMVKDSSYFRALRQMPLPDALCLYLLDARQTLMTGHHAQNSNTPHHSISSFPRRRISRQEAERRGLPIYPYHR